MESWIEIFHEYFRVESATTPEMVTQAMRLRYEVYCLEHSFEDPKEFPDGLEKDAFDSCSAHSLLFYRPSDTAAGTVRLVLPDRHNSAKKFPIEESCILSGAPGKNKQGNELMKNIIREEIAEVSRFTISKQFRKRVGEATTVHGITDSKLAASNMDERRRIPHLTVGLLRCMFQLSIENGITQWYAAMEPTLIRSLGSRFGMYFHPIGPVVDYHGRRQPSIANVSVVAAEIKEKRPDIWELVTEKGAFC